MIADSIQSASRFPGARPAGLRRRHWSASLGLMLALCAGVSHADAEGLIEIADTVWAVDVEAGSRQPTLRLTEARARQGVSLWMQVKGSAAALDKLAAEGKLPIRHKWFRETIAGVQSQGVTRMTDQIDIPVAQRQLLPKLRQELRDQGYFDWRTWSRKDNLLPGTWRVRVVYADNNPVLCGGAGERQPCEYSIEVR